MPGQSNSVGRVDDDGSDILDQSPELPSAGQRWTVRRKAAVVEGVRGGWIPIEEACRLYNISVDQLSQLCCEGSKSIPARGREGPESALSRSSRWGSPASGFAPNLPSI